MIISVVWGGGSTANMEGGMGSKAQRRHEEEEVRELRQNRNIGLAGLFNSQSVF